MKNKLLQVALRKNAIFLSKEMLHANQKRQLNETTSVLVANAARLGYTFSEELLMQLNGISPKAKLAILQFLKEVKGVNKNWTPLVKQWDITTGENRMDHVLTWFANIFKTSKGTTLPCGHIIPKDTFPMERYNGCPFCGAQFEFDKLENYSNKGKTTVLELWKEEDMQKYLSDLLQSPVALDANQADDVKLLIGDFVVTDGIEIKMKETLMLLIDALVASGKETQAGTYFKSPNDILRYLWYKHTGFLQLVEPKVVAKRMSLNARNSNTQIDQSKAVKMQSMSALKLKFDRPSCKRYAQWLNNLSMNTAAQCENMHPKRGMWVRVIRALRLAEYSKRKGFENLAELLDTFYNKDYDVWQGQVNTHRFKMDAIKTFALLKQRPGLFARSLFSSMLWFGPDETMKHFREVVHSVPKRLVYTLNMYAEVYFDREASRTVKPLGGKNKRIPTNQLLQLYTDAELERMKGLIRDLSLEVIKENLRIVENPNKTIYIHEGLSNIPIAIGDRSEHIQDTASALMGTRFKVEGDTIRLFLQWGEGLPAMHLDMDLSCNVVYDNRSEFCSYSRLVIAGCKHSGDIQRIPKMVGTAEYIDIDIIQLEALGAKFVSFTCNAFTNGALSPNMLVGWMQSKHKMKISKSGVAYNPADVQHQVRIKQTLSKGMVFGVLDVAAREIVWLEMSFGGQVVQNMDGAAVKALLAKLDAKLKIGDLLQLKAEVQDLEIVSDPAMADETFDMDWALNTAEVSKLF